MGMTCLVCRDPRRPEIDADILSGHSIRTLAERYGISTTSIFRHKRDHAGQMQLIVESDEQVQEVIEQAKSGIINRLQGPQRFESRLQELREKIDTVLEVAKEKKDYDLTIRAFREARGLLDLESRIILGLLGLKTGDEEKNAEIRYRAV